MIPQNRTKIVATIGPSSDKKEVLEKMIDAGLDMARFNFSHGKYDVFKRWLDTIRRISKEKEQPVAILQDLQGPRIRIGEGIPKRGVLLKENEIVNIGCGKYKKGFVPIDYKGLIKDLKKGTKILLVDGLVELEVIEKNKNVAKAKVIMEGKIFSRKGVNIPNAKLSIPTITEKDKKDLIWGVDNKVDYIGLSFVRSAKDIRDLRNLIKKRDKNSGVRIVAKIEKQEALDNLDGIMKEVDGVMIARGDLGIELPSEDVPVAQKKIILKALDYGKPVITKIIAEIEKEIFDEEVLHFENISKEDLNNLKRGEKCTTPAETVGASAREIAIGTGAKYIVAATVSGYSARMISRNRPKTFILAVSPDNKVVDQLSIVWGIRSFHLPIFHTADELMLQIADLLKKKRLVKKGDNVIVVSSHPVGKSGKTNLIKIQEIN